MRKAVLEAIETLGNPTPQTIATFLGVKEDELIDPIFTLAYDNIITWPGASSTLSSSDILRISELDSNDRTPNKSNSADTKKHRG